MKKEAGLMETILGFKMLKGRVEPYSHETYASMRKFDPHSHRIPTQIMKYEPANSPANNDKTGFPRRGPKTPPGPGPKTPPGSPISQASNRPSSPRSDIKQSSSPLLEPPPSFPIFSGNDGAESNIDEKAALLKEMSELTNTPIKQLENFIGDDLQKAIGKVDRSILFSTLKDALRNIGQASTSEIPNKNTETK